MNATRTFTPVRSVNGADSYQPGATPRVCVHSFHQGPTARPIGGEINSTIVAAARGWDGLSALGLVWASFLGRCPRLVWERTFGARERRATSNKPSRATWRRFWRRDEHAHSITSRIRAGSQRQRRGFIPDLGQRPRSAFIHCTKGQRPDPFRPRCGPAQIVWRRGWDGPSALDSFCHLFLGRCPMLVFDGPLALWRPLPRRLRQIRNLRRTRDLLLPRLLSGQVNVT